ncbi:MAG: HAD family hydrolase [Frankia sp.]
MAGPGVLFDLDGTLVDTVYEQVAVWRRTLATVGLDVAGWRIHRLLGRGFTDDTLREITAGSPRPLPELRAALGPAYAAAVAQMGLEPRPVPGARALLGHLSRNAVPWGVVTGGQPGPSRAALAALDALDAPLVTAADVCAGKPDPEMVLTAAAVLRVDPPAIIVVGDSVWDVRAARAAGARGVAVLSGGTPRADLWDAGASAVVDDVADLARDLPAFGLPPLRAPERVDLTDRH